MLVIGSWVFGDVEMGYNGLDRRWTCRAGANVPAGLPGFTRSKRAVERAYKEIENNRVCIVHKDTSRVNHINWVLLLKVLFFHLSAEELV